MRIHVIVNTNARAYRRDVSLLGEMLRVCSDQARLHATRRIEELDVIAEELAQRGADLVVLSGGDGSFMAGVTALSRAFGARALPQIALLPGGTVATVARNFGMKGSPVALLMRLFASPNDVEITRSSTLRVRQTLGGETIERIGFIFGTGLVARFFDLYYAAGAGGYAGAARITARVFVDSFYGGPYAERVLTPMPCVIEADGARVSGDRWSLVCAAVVRDLGLGMKVNHRASERLDRVHLVASQLLPRSLGPRAPLVLLGKPIGGPGHVDDLFKDFIVRFESEGPYVLDGDMLRASEVHVSPGPVLEIVSVK